MPTTTLASPTPIGPAALAHDEESVRDALAAARRPRVLCVMRIPPNPDGHGGSQRAWHLLQALRALGDVHFVLVYREIDHDCMTTPLDRLAPLVASVTRIPIPQWQPAMRRRFGIVPGSVSDLWRMRSQDAPQLSARSLDAIAEKLPLHEAEIVFAGRLCSAVIVQSLIDRGRLRAPQRICDFDDIMSKFALRQVRHAATPAKLHKRVMKRIDAAVIARAEARIADGWDAVSVCTDADVAALEAGHPRRHVVKLPNVVDRPRLPARPREGRFRILFTGNLGFAPNIDGLRAFIEQAWPLVARALPQAELAVVGINPGREVHELVKRERITLHPDVPSLEPYYAACDVLIAPILFGSGTRIKILEAMAYGRPVVSTTVGAEGMGLVDGEHLLLADRMPAFAEALLALERDPALAARLADAAHRLVQTQYTPAAFRAVVAAMVRAPSPSALPLAA